MNKPPTRKQLQQAYDAFAPDGHVKKPDLPKFLTEKPIERKSRGNPEQLLQITLCDWMDLHGYFYWANTPHLWMNNPSGKVLNYMKQQKRAGMKKGVPDLCILREGKLYMAEVKSEKGYPSDEQKTFMDNASRRGAKCAVVRSLEDLKKLLDIDKNKH